MTRRTRSQTRFSELKPTTCAQGNRHNVLFFFTAGERTYRHPSSIYLWQDRSPDHKSTPGAGVWGKGSVLQNRPRVELLPGESRLCPPSAPLHPRRSPFPSQEPENKLGPLGWEGGLCKQLSLPQNSFLIPREICFTQMMITCLLQVPQIPAPSLSPTLPALQREASLCGAHSWQRGCPYSHGVGACWVRILEALNPCL